MAGSSKFYRFFSTPEVDYAAAMLNCQSFGGNLAMPKTNEEATDMINVLGTLSSEKYNYFTLTYLS